jgi:hypothetical protein
MRFIYRESEIYMINRIAVAVAVAIILVTVTTSGN